jgi:hypothetical protein
MIAYEERFNVFASVGKTEAIQTAEEKSEIQRIQQELGVNKASVTEMLNKRTQEEAK